MALGRAISGTCYWHVLFVGTAWSLGRQSGIGKGAHPIAMSAKKRAHLPAQFAELLEVFPCHAWIEDFSGQVLARNAHPCLARSRCHVKTATYSLPSLGNAKGMRIVALFPAKQKTDCQWRVISALLAKTLQVRQIAVVDENLLTPRQREIYRELAHGHSYKTIAANLGISHVNILVQTTRMRKNLGTKFLPLLRKKAQRLVS